MMPVHDACTACDDACTYCLYTLLDMMLYMTVYNARHDARHDAIHDAILHMLPIHDTCVRCLYMIPTHDDRDTKR